MFINTSPTDLFIHNKKTEIKFAKSTLMIKSMRIS